jgi:Leucine-rich repeat (LRR) protein
MVSTKTATQSRPPRLGLTPDRVVLGLMVFEGLLWLSERCHCYSFSEDKTWTLLIAVGTAGIAMLWMLVWLALALLFRWRFQFGMRSLMLLVVAIAVPCSWLAMHMQEAKSQRQTIAAIRAARGIVNYSYEWNESMNVGSVNDPYEWNESMASMSGARPGMVPSFLLKILGEDVFVFDVAKVEINECNDTAFAALRAWRNLKSLSAYQVKVDSIGRPNLVESSLTDKGMEQLENFPGLEFLWLTDSPQVTSSGFRHLSRLRKLVAIQLDGCRRFCDADLANLRNAAALRWLDVGRTLVTGAGLAQLSRLHQLSTVGLCGAAITDDGLSGVESLSGLEDLVFDGTPVTDRGLVHLGKLTKLTHLGLNKTRVDGSGFKCLWDLKSLRVLDLANCRVTSEGLAGLRGLTGLRNLDLGCNRITDAGLANLRPLVGLEDLELYCNNALSDAAVEDLGRTLPQGSILFFKGDKVKGAWGPDKVPKN